MPKCLFSYTCGHGSDCSTFGRLISLKSGYFEKIQTSKALVINSDAGL